MAEKILNTRIQLRYDTLENWTSSTLALKKGELAIVTLGTVKDGSTAGDVNQHPVLFKVGDGSHTFAQLPFASALAADVYAWAKASDVQLTNKELVFVGTDKKVAIPYITEDEAKGFINDALAAYSTTEQMNAAIKVEADRAKAAEEALGERIDAFNLPEGGFASKTEFDALKGKVEDEDGALAKANEAYTLAGTKADATETTNALAEKADKSVVEAMYTNAKIDELLATKQDTIPENTYDAYGAAATAETNAKGYADKKLEDFEKAYITADGGTIDKLNEIAAWIADDQAGAAKVIADVAANAANITTLGGDLDKVELKLNGIADGDGTVKKYVDDQAAAAKSGAEQTAAGALSAAKSELEGKIDAKADAESLGTMAYEQAAGYYTKYEADNAFQAKGEYATAAQGAKADSAIQEVTAGMPREDVYSGLAVSQTGTSVNISIDDSLTFVFDCGDANGASLNA